MSRWIFSEKGESPFPFGGSVENEEGGNMIGALKKALGLDKNERALKRYAARAARINALEPELEKLSKEELAAKADIFRSRLSQGEEPDALLEEVFGVVREVSRRTLGLRHFDVQLMGGMALHEGCIAEMKTGEGKNPGLYLGGGA